MYQECNTADQNQKCIGVDLALEKHMEKTMHMEKSALVLFGSDSRFGQEPESPEAASKLLP